MSNYDSTTNVAATVAISLNGDPRRVPTGLTVDGLLQFIGLPMDRVAVELDRVIVRKSEWSATPVLEGAQIEVVHFVGGG